MKIATELSRRRFLNMSAALGGIVVCGDLATIFAQQKQTLTAEQALGPFYPMLKPLDRDADLTRLRGHHASAKGQVIYLRGRVVNARGNPLSGIKLEIWQANSHGRYAHINDTTDAPLDPNFQGYGVQVTDAKGEFHFKTIKPKDYPTGIDGWSRPPHIHYAITGRHEMRVTQMYFPGEVLNDKDRLLQSAGAGQSSLIAKTEPAGKDFEPDALLVTWTIVLTRG